MSILLILVAIILTTLRCRVNCIAGNDDVSNYFSSYVPRDYRNPIMNGISAEDPENYGYDKKEAIVEGIKNDILPQFSNLNLSQNVKDVLLKDYYLTKPYTKGDVSNLYNLDLLGSGLIDFNTKKKIKLPPSRPNYKWLNRNITWPVLWQPQYPHMNPFFNSSGYNLCNNHLSHPVMTIKDSILAKRSMDVKKTKDLKPENIRVINNDSLKSKPIANKNNKDITEHVENDFNNTALDDDNVDNKLKNLTSTIIQNLPSLSDIFVRKSENDLTKLFNSFNASSLLDKYENSHKAFQ